MRVGSMNRGSQVAGMRVYTAAGPPARQNNRYQGANLFSAWSRAQQAFGRREALGAGAAAAAAALAAARGDHMAPGRRRGSPANRHVAHAHHGGSRARCKLTGRAHKLGSGDRAARFAPWLAQQVCGVVLVSRERSGQAAPAWGPRWRALPPLDCKLLAFPGRHSTVHHSVIVQQCYHALPACQPLGGAWSSSLRQLRALPSP